MIPSKKQFLRQLTNQPELNDNVIAYVFGNNPNLDISQKNEFFDKVKFYYTKYKEKKPEINEEIEGENNIDEWLGKDLRIKNIRLKSVRGFPDTNIPFGINFTNDNQPQSMVVLGGNASGKSSIYDALEYMYCNEIGEAKLRDITDYKSFLSHFNNGFAKSFCTIETKDSHFDIQNGPIIPEDVRRRINPNTHFISDFDIYENGKLDYENNTSKSFHQLIAKSIGLEELLDFHKNLKAFILYRRSTESRKINSAKKNIKTQKEIIETTYNAIREKANILEKLENQKKLLVPQEDFSRLLNILNKLKEQNLSVSFMSNDIKSLINEYIKEYNTFLVKEVKNYEVREIQFLDLGLEILPKYDNCPFCLNSNSNTQEIENTVKERIAKINELRESEQKLKKISNDIIDKINNIFSQLKFLKTVISNEISESKEFVEFNNFIQVQITFEKYISDILDNELFSEISNLSENPNYLKDKNKYLYNLFSKNQNFISKFNNIELQINEYVEKRNNVILSIEKKFQDKNVTKPISEQIIEIKKEIKDYKEQIEVANKEIEKETLVIKENEDIQRLFSEIKEETKEYEKVVKNKLNEIVRSVFLPIKTVVEGVLEEFFNIDNRDLDIIISTETDEIDEETGEVLSEIITAKVKPKTKNIPPQSVGVVLNTFHYRIFSTMVGIAIAIASRINTKINLPLVLDDIFYASDFENRATIETFLKALFKIFSTYTPDMPLQLIFFTHDQFIFESAMKVLSELEEDNVAFAKLYPHTNAIVEQNYKNLIYKFPNYIANKVYNRMIETI